MLSEHGITRVESECIFWSLSRRSLSLSISSLLNTSLRARIRRVCTRRVVYYCARARRAKKGASICSVVKYTKLAVCSRTSLSTSFPYLNSQVKKAAYLGPRSYLLYLIFASCVCWVRARASMLFFHSTRVGHKSSRLETGDPVIIGLLCARCVFS